MLRTERTLKEFKKNHKSIRISYIVISKYKTLYEEERKEIRKYLYISRTINLSNPFICG